MRERAFVPIKVLVEKSQCSHSNVTGDAGLATDVNHM